MNGNRKRVSGTSLRLALLALVTSWQSAVATAQLLPSTLQVALTPQSQPTLLPAAAAARISLIVSMDRFLGDLDPQSREAAKLAFAIGNHRSAPWPILLRGALQGRRQSGAVGETLWFNPVFDAGLLLRWRSMPTGWQVTRAWWVLGSDIRQDKAGSPPRLALPIGDVDATSIADAISATPAAADLRYVFDHNVFPLMTATDWASPAASDDRKREVARRAWGAVMAMQAFDAATDHGAGRTRVLNYLMDAAIDPTATMPPATLQILRSLDRSTRASLYPVSAFKRADGRWRLVVQSADAPAVTIVVTLDAATVRVSEVEAFDYGAPATAGLAEAAR